jgi:iron-sulfur cluster assembly protein
VLTLTGPAVEAIRTLTTKPGIPRNSGLRIMHQDAVGGFELTIESEPGSGDEVIETDGVRVFLQHEAAEMLGGRSLSAEVTDDDVVFRIDDPDE